LDPLEVAGFLTGAIAVYLTAKEIVWCWPVGLVNVGLYTLVFWNAKLYADAGLQVVYAVLCLVGWWQWGRGGPGFGALHVTRSTPVELGVLAAVGAAGTLLLGTFLHRATDASFPYLDSALTSFSLVAQGMQTRKRFESWALWIAVDVVYVGMYLVKQLRLTAVLYAVFIALAVLGHREWKRSLSAASS